MSAKIPLKDKIIPWYFVIFFFVIASVDAVMVTLAVRTQTGLVTEHPYEKGLAYNKIVAADAAQEALGFSGKISYDAGMIIFTLRDKNQQIIKPERADAKFTRPTKAGFDFSAVLQSEKTPVNFPLPGLWEVRVNAVYQGNSYQTTKRIVIE
jgi:nitrogen fixation protein FixH